MRGKKDVDLITIISINDFLLPEYHLQCQLQVSSPGKQLGDLLLVGSRDCVSIAVVAAARAPWVVGGDQRLAGVGMNPETQRPCSLAPHGEGSESPFPLLGQADNVCPPLLSTPTPSDLSAQAYGLRVLGWVSATSMVACSEGGSLKRSHIHIFIIVSNPKGKYLKADSRSWRSPSSFVRPFIRLLSHSCSCAVPGPALSGRGTETQSDSSHFLHF